MKSDTELYAEAQQLGILLPRCFGWLLGFRDLDGLQQPVQLVLDQIRQLTHSALVHLDHVQVQLELLWDRGVGGLAVLGILTGLAG